MKLRASPILDRLGRQHAVPLPPVWFADAVEKWARSWGRHASTRWESAVVCFVSHLSRRDSDPALARVQRGTASDVDEAIYWHQWKEGIRHHPLDREKMIGGFISMDIEKMGESGVLEFLNKGNLWSGRGEFASLDAAADAHIAANDKRMVGQRTKLRDGLRGPLKDTLRHAKGHALSSVPDNITPK